MNHMLMTGMGQSPMEDIACGYCQLLVHFPFLILFIAAVIRQLATLLFVPLSATFTFGYLDHGHYISLEPRLFTDVLA